MNQQQSTMTCFPEGVHLEISEKNFLRNNVKFLYLPYTKDDLTHVKLVLMDSSQYRIISRYYPIRYGYHIGTQVILGGGYDNCDMTPSFYFDKKNNIWLLDSKGYVVFAEIEINYIKGV